MSGRYARRHRRVFGYVGDIQLSTEARGTLTPPPPADRYDHPWRYGHDPRILGAIVNFPPEITWYVNQKLILFPFSAIPREFVSI